MIRLARACLLAALLAAGVDFAGQPPSLLGHWILVEQTYGEGRSNLVDPEAPALRLEFFRQGAEIRARLGSGAERTSWPRLRIDLEQPVEMAAKEVSPAEDRIRVRYRVAPSPGDDLLLDVTEEYRVSDDGTSLVGTVRVQFTRDGDERGSYVLHRRFEREP